MGKSVIALVGLVIVAMLVFVFSNSGLSPKRNSESNTPIRVSDSTDEFSGSLADLARRGGAWRCTFTEESETVTSRGTVYVDGEKIRGDFESDTQGITVDSHMITDGAFIYTWSPIAPTGYKVPYSLKGGSGGNETSGQQSDLEQSYDYTCEAWTVDESKFIIPQISFLEVPQ